MYGQSSLMGLGINIDPSLTANIQAAAEAQPTTAGGGFLAWLNKTVQTVAPIVTTVKSTVDQVKSGSATNNPTMQIQPAPMAPKPAMSQGTKIALAVGAAALVGGLIYAGSRKKRK